MAHSRRSLHTSEFVLLSFIHVTTAEYYVSDIVDLHGRCRPRSHRRCHHYSQPVALVELSE